MEWRVVTIHTEMTTDSDREKNRFKVLQQRWLWRDLAGSKTKHVTFYTLKSLKMTRPFL